MDQKEMVTEKIETTLFRNRFSFLFFILTALFFLMALIAGLESAPAYGDINRWTSNGPEGGEISALAIHSLNPNILYAGTGGGVYKSTNGATSWKLASSGLTHLVVYCLVIDPGSPGLGRLICSNG